MRMIFSTIEEAKRHVYDSYDNILSEDVNPSGEYCYVFFSSNGLCDDESIESYMNTLVDQNRYEWRSIANAIKRRRSTGRCIFVRDVYLKWYIYGVSRKNNTIDGLVDKLKQITSDREWKIVTVGISSGGFIATIAGLLLGAEKIYNISGQYDLSVHNPAVFEEYKKTDSQYGSIVNMVKEYDTNIAGKQTPILYFCPIGCEHDKRQYELVKDIECVKTFLFPDTKHAATVYPFSFPDLLTKPVDRMERLYQRYKGRIIDKKAFLIRTMTLKGWSEFAKRALSTRLKVEGMKKAWDVK